jgi:hypothetical protein
LKHLLLTACIALSAPMLHAAGEPAATTASHPLVGTWTWALFGGSCTETLHYRSDRTVLATSGQEVAEKTYEVTKAADAAGFYKLVETVVRQNDKKDCSGALLSGPGEESTRFVQFSPLADKMLVCQNASLKACYGPLVRVR